MQEWWAGLMGVTQLFYGMAAFFSIFFLWQLISAFMGLDGDAVDIGGDAMDIAIDGELDDVMESSQAFKVLSVRSIITFFTLFSWGSALYTNYGVPVPKAMGMASIWGVAGMTAIAGILYFLGRMTESGTKDIGSCKGQIGEVYLNIPAEGFGEIKIAVDGVVDHVKARSVEGVALSAGTQVRVVKASGQSWVEVEKLTEKGE
jgi:hypothetical protein